MLTLLILALADPLPGPREEEPLPELQPVEPSSALADDRFHLGIGVTVAMGAYALENRWTAAATFSIDLHADLGRVELVLSPHATVHVHDETAGLFGFEGQLVFALGEYLAVGVGTEQLVSVSRRQLGALRFGPTLRPFIARAGRHRISLQLAWLALGANETEWKLCSECNERPTPYYTLGYGVLF